ncbi:sensor histidine kinase [Roseovarius sp. S1116L3]|uniref:sensor histidine kinase n=1 Tax=Roseovarius roseus TaxID=3342636 RepID=UPI0037282EB8
MDRGSVLSGDAFRTAIYSASVFVFVLGAAGIAAYFYVQKTMLGEIEQQVLQEKFLLNEVYSNESGLDGVVTTVQALDSPVELNGRAIGIFDDEGARLAGNVATAPDRLGWARGSLEMVPEFAAGSIPEYDYYHHTYVIGDQTFVLGRGLDLVRKAEMTMIRVLIVLGLIIVLLILRIGFTTSRASLGKLERLEGTLDRVSQGATSERLEVSSRNDQIDRISRRVNVHLDRLDQLMVSTRTAAAAVAHDLKTPLSRAFLSLDKALREVERKKDPRQMIEASQEELTRLNSIFDTILRIARLESQSAQGEFHVCDMRENLEGLAETLKAIMEDNGQNFVLDIEDEGAFNTRCDAGMMRQLVMNLVQNSMNYCPAGSTVTVSLARDGSGIILSVADDGPGIPAEDRSHVLDPFYRVDGSRTKPGNGLGLSLVKAIAGRHGAQIMLTDNAPGLKVTLRFPVAEGGQVNGAS